LPLAFESTTHGTVAFGFFNIETDMLLLENRFFFATDFASWAADLARVTADHHETTWDVWTVDRREDVGDLHGAIRGVRFTGFIGAVYRRFPFPAEPEGFRQQPEGDRVQEEVRGIAERWARREAVPVKADREADEISVGGIGFTSAGWRELVEYVRLGGYPRWRDGSPPLYVVEMLRALEAGPGWIR
jgi:hypothetical protein